MRELFRCAGMGARYEASTDGWFQEQVARARDRLYQMGICERHSGFASPEDDDLDSHARTALSALAAGLVPVGKQPDWECLWDAYAMLQDIERRIRTMIELTESPTESEAA